MDKLAEQNATSASNDVMKNDVLGRPTEPQTTEPDSGELGSPQIPLEMEAEIAGSQEMSSRRMLKNIVVICVVFFFNFLAFNGMATLQSSIHVQGGMGVLTQDVLYVSVAVSSLLLPKIIIGVLGHKLCFSVALLTYILWMAANGYAVWATMVPASAIAGVGSAIFWTTQGSYFTIVGGRYAASTGEDVRTVLPRFFGLLFGINKLSSVVGSVISSAVLRQRPANVSTPDEKLLQQTCGLNDCPGNHFATNETNSNLGKPSDSALWTLVGVYIAIGFLAFLISCLFVDKLPDSWLSGERGRSACTRSVALSSLMATLRQMANTRQLLLIPLSMYTGLEQTFQDAEYTKSFVSCFLGVWMVGLVNIPQLLANAATSLAGGKLARVTGILPLCVLGMVMTLTNELTLLFWVPSLQQEALFYITPCWRGIADGIWQVQLNAAHGVLFPANSEAAFATYKFWQSMGRIQEFAYSSVLCTNTKLYILIAFFAFGIVTFLVVYFAFMRTLDEEKANNVESIVVGLPMSTVMNSNIASNCSVDGIQARS